jgi:hypothetical protein
VLRTVRLSFYANSPEANFIDAALAKNPNPAGLSNEDSGMQRTEPSGPVGLGPAFPNPLTQLQNVAPVCWVRTKDGKIDWSEDCLGHSRADLIDDYDEDSGYDAIPLYTLGGFLAINRDLHCGIEFESNPTPDPDSTPSTVNATKEG